MCINNSKTMNESLIKNNVSDNYWQRFPSISPFWHNIKALVLFLIGFTAIIAKTIVVRHLIRFNIKFSFKFSLK